MPTYIMMVSCPDRKGIVAAVSTALVDLDANILQNAQFTDPVTDTFCMRCRFETDISETAQVSEALTEIASRLNATLTVRREDHRRRALLMVSKHDHCLVDLLYRRRTGAMQIDIPVVISNHPDLRDIVLRDGIEFEHVPVTGETRERAEARLIELLAKHDIDFVVLARYMQILSNDLCDRLPGRIINIHHSFLPGFKGAKPYHQAIDRGVKIIGATAHFVTGDLDEGPIISQDVASITHRDTVETATAKGKDIERLVLAAAVRAHGDDRVFLIGDRTVVLD